MTDEERRIITAYVERVSGAAPQQAAASPWGGNAPQTQAPPSLPPVDPEADRLLWELFNRYPESRYRITQTAFVQEAALVEAQNRIRQLEWEVENARRQGQAIAAQGGQRGGLFGGMFGGGARQPAPAPMPPPPQPQYPPGYNPQAVQQMAQPGRGGSGFLGTALTTAAGVAGGMVLGSVLMNAFSGHGGGAHAGGLFGGSGGGGAQEALAASPWTDPGAAGGWGGTKDPAPADQGQSWGNADYASSGGSDQQGWGGQDQGGWDNSTSDYGGSSDGGFDGGGGDENI